MADFIRTLFRQGPEIDRTNVILRSGEPAYVTDYKRLIVGDGTTPGGIPVGTKFLGFTQFDPFSSEVNNVSPGVVGDIMFCETTNLLYVLSGAKTILGKKAYQIQSNYKPINKTPAPDEITISSNGGTQLSLIQESIDGRFLAGYSLGRGLGRNASNPGIIEMALPGEGLGFVDNVLVIEDGGVALNKIEPIRANRVLATLGEGGSPQPINLQDFANAIRTYLQGDEGNGALGIPIGTIIDYAGPTPPSNYLPCDGRELSVEIYPELFNAIKYTWGKPSELTFNLPNLNQRTTVGSGVSGGSTGSSEDIGNDLGNYGGVRKFRLSAKQLPPHVHGITFTLPAHTHNFNYTLPDYVVDVPGGVYTTGNVVRAGLDNYVTIIQSQANNIQVPVTFPRGPIDDLSNARSQAGDVLLSNKAYIQLATIDFVKRYSPTALSAVTMSASEALSAKCYRDTGYIVDSIAADLKNNANHRSVETGLLYFAGYITANKNPGSTVPALPIDQVKPTIDAIKAIGNFITGYNVPLSSNITSSGILSSEYFFTNPQQKKIVNGLRIFSSVIDNNANIPATRPNGTIPGDDTFIILSNSLSANKTVIQTSTINFVNTNYPDVFSGNPELSDKCYRDVGFIVDAMVADLKNNANHRSIEVGNSYFTGAVLERSNNDGSEIPSLPIDQIIPTIEAIKNIDNIINSIAPGEVTENALNKTTDLINCIVYPLSSGGALREYNPPGVTVASDISLAQTILSNKTVIQSRVTNYVLGKKYLSLGSINIDKCTRDVGYMVDALVQYLTTGVDARLVQYAAAYWEGSSSRLPENLIPFQRKNTKDTIEFLKNVILDIVGLSNVGIHKQVNDLINTMIYPLESNGKSLQYIPAGNPTNDDFYAADIIERNKSFIQTNIAGYVRRLGIIAGNTTLESKCNRDVGYMIDSVLKNLRTGVNAGTIQYGLAYWDGSANRINKPGVRGNASQVSPTVQTIKELSRQIIKLLVENDGGKNSLLTITGKTSAGGNIKLYERTDDTGINLITNDLISNLQPSAVVNKCIKVK
jgi:microcystin-dependent protein